jgi:hypothetical protein
MLLQYGAGGALYPFLAPYLAAKGFAVRDISWATLAAAGMATVMPFVWGALADRVVAVNRLVALLHLVAAGVLLGWSGLEAFAAVFALYVLYTAFQQPTNSLVNALSFHNLDDPASQFGGLRLWGSIGWILPSLPIGLWLAWRSSPTFDSVVFFAAAYHGALFLCAPFWPHTPPAGRRVLDGERGGARRRFLDDVRALVRAPGFVLLLVAGFFTLASFPVMFFFGSLALERSGVPKPWLGPAMALGVVGEIPLFLLLRSCLSRFGFRAVLAAGVTTVLLRHLVYAFATEPLPLVLGSFLNAPCIVFFVIAASLAVDRIAAVEVRATAQALFTLMGNGLGGMCGLLGCGVISTVVTDGDSLAELFVFGAGLAGAGLFCLPFVRFR